MASLTLVEEHVDQHVQQVGVHAVDDEVDRQVAAGVEPEIAELQQEPELQDGLAEEGAHVAQQGAGVAVQMKGVGQDLEVGRAPQGLAQHMPIHGQHEDLQAEEHQGMTFQVFHGLRLMGR